MDRRSTRLLALATLLGIALVSGLATGAEAADVVVDVHADAAPQEVRDPNGTLELVNWTAGESHTWNLTTSTDYTTIDLRIHGGFNVTQGKQLVPLVGGDHFVELHGQGPGSVDDPATVFNLTAGEDGDVSWTYRLGVPGPTGTNLTLHRDVDPPGYELGTPRNVTHVGFDLRTETSETALAVLVVEPPEGVDEIVRRFPTPRPAPVQRFPVQGLSSDTTYRWSVEFTDWSGNTVRTSPRTVTTAPAPDPPEPVVTPVSPVPNGTVRPTGVIVEARWESPESPVVPGGIHLFVDKVPIPDENISIEGDRLRYLVPEPLPAREVSVAVEVPNLAGGIGIARWSFVVQEAASTDRTIPLEPGLALAGLAIAGLLAGRGRRG